MRVKKTIAMTLTVLFMLTFLACGSKSGSTSKENSDGTAIGDTNADNWTTVIKNNFLLDLSMPDGWSISEAYSPNGVNNVKVKFVTGDSSVSDSFAREIFAACQSSGSVDKDTFEDAVMLTGILSWKYTFGDTTKIINVFYDIEGSFELTIS